MGLLLKLMAILSFAIGIADAIIAALEFQHVGDMRLSWCSNSAVAGIAAARWIWPRQ